jgi:hypothetical protein
MDMEWHKRPFVQQACSAPPTIGTRFP